MYTSKMIRVQNCPKNVFHNIHVLVNELKKKFPGEVEWEKWVYTCSKIVWKKKKINSEWLNK